MILQFKREEENLCGHRGLLPGSDQQTYTIIAPKNLRFFYEKLIHPITDKTNHNHQLLNNRNLKFDNNFEKTILTYHNINRFFAAFIDHVSAVNACTMVNCINLYSFFQALKDVDYVVKEKNVIERFFDCEISSNVSDSKGVFYLDGHSFAKVLFYGNENTIFGFEYLLFTLLLFYTGNFLIASLSIGTIFKVISYSLCVFWFYQLYDKFSNCSSKKQSSIILPKTIWLAKHWSISDF